MTVYVLVIEDELIREELVDRLEKIPEFSVRSAITLAEATRFIGEQPPDVVFLDMHLPDTDGVETLKIVRGLLTAAIIVVCSAFPADSIMGGVGQGKMADYYLPKPIKPELFETLVAALKKELALKRPWKED